MVTLVSMYIVRTSMYGHSAINVHSQGQHVWSLWYQCTQSGSACMVTLVSMYTARASMYGHSGTNVHSQGQ